jgi:hypothetical protein
VDAWPRQPVICLPSENCWDYEEAEELWVADVLKAGFDIMQEYTPLAATLRDSVKAQLKQKHKGQIGGTYAHASNWDWERPGNTCMGRIVFHDGSVDVPEGIRVPLPPRPAPGRGVVYF